MNIKELREKTNLSQSDFGARIGVKHQTILLYEKGKNIPDTVKKLIRYEFAEHLPEENRLVATPLDGETFREQETSLAQLKTENEQLKKRVAELEKDKDVLQAVVQNLTGRASSKQQTG